MWHLGSGETSQRPTRSWVFGLLCATDNALILVASRGVSPESGRKHMIKKIVAALILIAGLVPLSFAQKTNSVLIQEMKRDNHGSQVQRLEAVMKRSLTFDQMKLIEENCSGQPRIDITPGAVHFRCLSSRLIGYNDEYISAGSFTGDIRMVTRANGGRFVFCLEDKKVLHMHLPGRMSFDDFNGVIDASIVQDDTLREALSGAYKEEKTEREMQQIGDGLNRQ